MPSSDLGFGGFRRARRLRNASRVAFALWMVAWVAIGVVVGTNRAADLVSALAVVICLLFGSAVALEAAARRLETRELRAIAARDDLSASRSRGYLRVR